MKRVSGSVKNKITASELVEERKGLDFDVLEFRKVAGGEDMLWNEFCDKLKNLMEEHPEIANKQEFHEWTPSEKIKWWYKRINHLWYKAPERRKELFRPSETTKRTRGCEWWDCFQG